MREPGVVIDAGMALPRLAARAGYVLVLLLGLAALVEGAARATTTYEDTVFSPQNARLVDHPTRLFTLRPGWHDPGPPEFTVNADGFRGPPLQPHTPDRRRILLLGESSTMGAGVGDDEVYARVLERLLADAGHPEWEVINAGVGAWTIWQSAVMLAEEIDRLDPAVVIPYHQANDFLATGVVDEHNFLYEVRGTDRELYDRRKPVAPLLSLAYHSRAYLLLRKRVLTDSARELPTLSERPSGSGRRVPDADRRIAWEWIGQVCEGHHTRLLPTIPAYRTRDYSDHVIDEFATAHGLPLLDLDAARREAKADPDRFFLDAVHPSAEGHRFLAAQLRDAVLAATAGG